MLVHLIIILQGGHEKNLKSLCEKTPDTLPGNCLSPDLGQFSIKTTESIECTTKIIMALRT